MRYYAAGITALFSTGILTADFFGLQFYPLAAITMATVITAACVVVKKAGTGMLFTVLVSLLFFLAGALRLTTEHAAIQDATALDTGTGARYTGIVTGLELPDGNRVRMRFAGMVQDTLTGLQAHGSFLLYIRFQDPAAVNDFLTHAGYGSTFSGYGFFVSGTGVTNPGARDFSSILRRKGLLGTVLANSKEASFHGAKQDNISNMLFNARLGIYHEINRLHTPDAAALLNGLVIGSRSDLPEEIQQDFLRAGITHILAISGSNVAFFLIALLFFTGRMHITIRFFAILPALFLFAALTGGTASVYRAVVMAAVFYAAKAFSRNTNGMNTLAVSALIILVINPDQLFDAGFQLSYSAVAGILAINPVMEEWMGSRMPERAWIRNPLLLLMTSVSAQLGTLPFVLYYFQQFSIAGLAANMAAIPLSGFLLGNGIITLLFSMLSHTAAQATAASSELMSGAILIIAKYAAGWSNSVLAFPYMDTVYCSLLFMVVLLFMITARYFTTPQGRILLLLLTGGATGVLLYSARTEAYSPVQGLHFLQVRNGTSLLIKVGNYYILSGAGRSSPSFNPGNREVLPYLQYANVDTIHLLLVPSASARHIASVLPLLRRVQVKTVVCPPDRGKIAYSVLQSTCRRYQIQLQDSARSVYAGGITVTTVPVKAVQGYSRQDVLFEYGGIRFLVTSNTQSAARAVLARDNRYPACNALVIEKGSRTGKVGKSSLQAFTPRLVISEQQMQVYSGTAMHSMRRSRKAGNVTFINLKQDGYTHLQSNNGKLFRTTGQILL